MQTQGNTGKNNIQTFVSKSCYLKSTLFMSQKSALKKNFTMVLYTPHNYYNQFLKYSPIWYLHGLSCLFWSPKFYRGVKLQNSLVYFSNLCNCTYHPRENLRRSKKKQQLWHIEAMNILSKCFNPCARVWHTCQPIMLDILTEMLDLSPICWRRG